MNKRKVTKIVLSILFIGLIISGLVTITYSLFSVDVYGTNTNDYSTGLLSIEVSSKSDKISLTNTLPMTDEEGLQTTPYVFTIKNTGNLDYQFDVELLSTSSNSFSSQYIKLQIDDGDVTTLAENNGVIKENVVLLAGESIDISIRIWLDIDTPNTELGKSFESDIAITGQAIYSESDNSLNAADYITSLYNNADKTIITNNFMNYYQASSVFLMNDRLGGTETLESGIGNIRYYGADPNNYVYFNCSEYPETNCEVWRIIGVFDDMVKLIKNESIGEYSWDSSETGYGNNDWSQAALMKLLNPGYESESIGGSLYYNSDDGVVYTYANGTTSDVDFSDSGLKNEITKNMIADVTWYLGAWAKTDTYPWAFYESERGTTVYEGNATTWTGKIAPMYVSDYGFATDFGSCSYFNLIVETCVNGENNWLQENWSEYFLTHSTTNYYGSMYKHVFYTFYSDSGYVYVDDGASGAGNWTFISRNVRPTLYLNSNVTIVSGEGSSSEPYRLSYK